MRSVVLSPGADSNGFALMLSELLRQNVVDRPEKRGALARLRGRVAIVVVDAGVSVTLACDEDDVIVHSGVVGIPDVTIRATSDDLTQMSLMELVPRLGVPNPRGAVTRAIAEASRSGRIQVYGALLHAPTVLRLTRLLSVN